MKLVTWNINSVRARLPLVAQFIADQQPDILCLQEIKVSEDMFPASFFADLGYPHQAVHGQKGLHGVATLSRLPFDAAEKLDWCEKGDARHIAVTTAGITLHNFYVPAGGDEPDPSVNEKFAHKLQFMAEMTAWSAGLRGDCIMLGDLNVAPLPEDVWSHKQLLRVVSHTPVETDALQSIQSAHPWVDVVREHFGPSETLFSWWSYRARDWAKSNRGRRLDHIWASPRVASKATHVEIYSQARSWEKPSDHAPVIANFAL